MYVCIYKHIYIYSAASFKFDLIRSESASDAIPFRTSLKGLTRSEFKSALVNVTLSLWPTPLPGIRFLPVPGRLP